MRAWEQFIGKVESELGSETVNKWLRTLRISHFDAGNLYLEAFDSFQAMWFEEHVRQRALHGFKNDNGRPVKIHLTINGDAPPAPKPKKKRKSVERTPYQLKWDEIDPNAKFEHFIVTEQNDLAFRLLAALVGYEPESGEYGEPSEDLGVLNPVYLSGASGTGKSHLLMATAARLLEMGMKVRYVRGPTFTEHVVAAIRAGEMHTFREAYRSLDVLIVDDVEILSGKGATQEEFFHTFNSLHLANLQIILSATCSPSELQEVEPRLVSRFEWGIVVPLERPTQEQLEKVLVKKAEVLQFPISKKVRAFLLETFTSSTQSLIRALEALVLRVHMNHKGGYLPTTAVEVSLVRHLLADLIKDEQRSMITPEKIIGAVSDQYGVSEDEIMGRSQNREHVMPRKMAMYLCRTRLNMPYKRVGSLFHRDHSTVMSSVRQVDGLLGRKDETALNAHQAIVRKLQPTG